MNLKKKLIKICISCIGGILIFDFINSLKKQKDFDVEIVGIDKDMDAHGKVLCDKFINVGKIARHPIHSARRHGCHAGPAICSFRGQGGVNTCRVT